MSNNDSNRIMARQFTTERVLTLDELKLVAGGAVTTDTGLMCDSAPSQNSYCGSSDDNPCDLDYWESD
jgi:hypothetical protein